jgi:hypothetical protein
VTWELLLDFDLQVAEKDFTGDLTISYYAVIGK